MPRIQNVARSDIVERKHILSENAVLISINDPCSDPPHTTFPFSDRHNFYFLDIDEEDNEFSFSDEQAQQIAAILKDCFDKGQDVVVHCYAGVCRSGAVAVVGEQLGFELVKGARQPNVLVKKKLLKELGFYYDYEELGWPEGPDEDSPS